MSNENYVNYYVEILTSTMTDAVIRNISLQANGKISESVIAEQQSRIDKLNSEINTIESLQSKVHELNGMKAEYENIKHQANHVDTFRSELIKERELHQQTRNDYELKIKELNEKIEYLQLTPAKRKKIDDSKLTPTIEVTEGTPTLFNIDTTIKDGGSF